MSGMERTVWNAYVEFRTRHECRITNVAIAACKEWPKQKETVGQLADAYVLIKSYSFIEWALRLYGSNRGWYATTLADAITQLRNDSAYREFQSKIEAAYLDNDWKKHIPEITANLCAKLERMRKLRNSVIHDWRCEPVEHLDWVLNSVLDVVVELVTGMSTDQSVDDLVPIT